MQKVKTLLQPEKFVIIFSHLRLHEPLGRFTIHSALIKLTDYRLKVTPRTVQNSKPWHNQLFFCYLSFLFWGRGGCSLQDHIFIYSHAKSTKKKRRGGGEASLQSRCGTWAPETREQSHTSRKRKSKLCLVCSCIDYVDNNQYYNSTR